MRRTTHERSQSLWVPTVLMSGLAVRRRATFWLVLLATVLIAISTYAIQSYRLSMAPDIFVDEVTYYFVGNSIAQGDGMRQYWLTPESVFFWHPPFYFLIEAPVLLAFKPLITGTLTAVVLIRHLTVALAALTAGLLFFLGRRLRDVPTGFLMVLLFALDPFILRSARRNLLEIPLMTLMVGGVLLLSYYPGGLNRFSALSLGIIFGLAMLTKEIAFYILLLPLLVAILGQPVVFMLLEDPRIFLRTLRQPKALRSVLWASRPHSLPWIITCGIISLLIYSLYPLWAWYNGYWQDFWFFRTYQFRRFEGSVQASGWNTGGKTPSFIEALTLNIPLYGTSYALIAIGSIFGIYLLLRSRKDVGARLLSAWFILSGLFFGFVILRGQLNDQFFYMLIIPNTACIGYGISLIVQDAVRAVHMRSLRLASALLLSLLIAGEILTNGVLYYRAYVVGIDNGYTQVHSYLVSHIPIGTPLLIGGDVGIHLFPEYSTFLVRTKQEVYDHHIHYFVLSSKEAWGNYNGVTQEFYDWVRANAIEQFAIDEPTFWHLAVYYMAYPDESPRQSGPDVPTTSSPTVVPSGDPVTNNPGASTTPSLVSPPAVLVAARPIPPTGNTDSQRYFPATGHGISGAFKQYWEANGGLAIFGYPLTEAYLENGQLVQYFERMRLEQNTSPNGSTKEIRPADLGRELTSGRTDRAAFAPITPSMSGVRSYFPATGHTLSPLFSTYWEAYGAQELFGMPISEEMIEVNPSDGRFYTVQYFEHARLEYHPESNDPAMSILLGHLGREALLDRGWQP